MLSPKKVIHRKTMKGLNRLRGVETRGCELEFGDFGLRAMESAWVTNREIEASRVAIARSVKRGGKIWLRIFPDHPLTKKPAETRMGSGKGAPEQWVAEVRRGRIVFEMTGVPFDVAKKALLLAAAKLSIKTEIIKRPDTLL